VPTPASAPDTLETIQALADAGKLAEAAARGEALLARGPTPGLVYLLGVIADGTGQAARAETLYRKALYLDPHHAAALAQLALHHEQRGDHRSARALRARAQRTLSKESA
jgi:chemotaxis protein methyltransferase WspC